MTDIDERKLKKVLKDFAKTLPQKSEWKPLEKAVPEKQRHGFMFMGTYPFTIWRKEGGYESRTLYQYKHGITRQYISIAKDGLCYCKEGDLYRECSCENALDDVFEDIREMGATRETKYDEKYKQERNKALADAGFVTIGVSPNEIEYARKEFSVKEKIRKKPKK